MGKKMACLVLTLVLCLTVLMPAALAGTPTSFVKLPAGWTALNVRAGAGTNYAVVTWVKDGDEIDIIHQGSTWSKITVSRNGKTGYIKNTYIKDLSENPATPSDPGTVGTASAGSVSGNRVNMRKGPGSGYAWVSTLTKGTKVQIWGESGNWYFITTLSGTKGWMSKTYIASGYSMTTSANLNFRQSANGTVISTLSAGTTVEVISITGGWSKVKVGSTTGYVYNKYLK